MSRRKAQRDPEIPETEIAWRVMFRDKDGKQYDKYFKDEEQALEYYYSIESPNILRELDEIRMCRFCTKLWQRLE